MLLMPLQSGSAEAQQAGVVSTEISPRVQELFRQAKCGSTHQLNSLYQAADVL